MGDEKDVKDPDFALSMQWRYIDVDETYRMRGELNRVAANIVEWRKRKGFSSGWHNMPTKLMLMVTELAEAMEAFRHFEDRTINYLQEHEPQRLSKLPQAHQLSAEQLGYVTNFCEEMADVVIRILDTASSCGIDLEHEINKKMHKNEGRPFRHGKRC